MSMQGQTDRPRDLNIAGRRAGAFTIIEMMVVIGILIILVTLVVSVSKYVYDEASRKQTQASQSVILAAIEAYHAAAVPNEYPPDDDNPLTPCQTLVQYLTGKHDDNLDGALEKDLTSRAEVKAAVADLANLQTECYDGSAGSVFKDGYGNDMDYDMDGGLGGTPVIISAGPDGDLTTTEDNIRSDRN